MTPNDRSHPSAPHAVAQGAVSRSKAVEQARQNWIKRLIDLSRRNNLLYYRELRAGTLDLSNADPASLTALLAGDSVALSRLVVDNETTQASARIRSIRLRALANLEEKGIQTLFVALGMATWTHDDDGRPPAAAVLLLPVAIEARGRERLDVVLRRTGELQFNLVLLHVLEASFGLTIAADAIVGDATHEDAAFDQDRVFGRLIEAAQGIPGFAIQSVVALSNFSFQKLAMVRDLQDHASVLAAHDVIAAIAGDGEASARVRSRRVDIDPARFDQLSPDTTNLILDADWSQQRVIEEVLAGESGVVQGPPGTGKSQTIANLIAALAAAGKRVLFVAEKRAALEVVARRLEGVGLGHILLDLHGADISRRDIMRRFGESLWAIRNVQHVDASAVHGRYTDRRTRLREHVERLHTPRPPSDLSVFELQSRLLAFAPDLRAKTRWRGAALDALTSATATTVRDLLVEAAGFGGLLMGDDVSPWAAAPLATGVDVQQAVDLVARLRHQHWPALHSAISTLLGSVAAGEPETVADAQSLLELLGSVGTTLRSYSPTLYEQDLGSLATALTPATEGWLTATWNRWTNSSFRAARATVNGLRSAPADDATIFAEVGAAADQVRRWREQVDGPALPFAVDHTAAATALASFESDLRALATALHQPWLQSQPFDSIVTTLDTLARDTYTPYRLPRLREIERILDSVAGAFVAELRSSRPDAAHWPRLFENAWLQSCLDAAFAQDPALAGFNSETHDKTVDEFEALDRETLTLAVSRVRRRHAERAIATMNAHVEQTLLVRREAEKRTRHLPLRRLMAEAPDVLTALRPCWMASPLSVSQLVHPEQRYFDVVIFDEASQVPPEDAVSSLMRGTQVVVAGDRHQLPPTLFFAAGEGETEGDEAATTEGFESLLDLMTASFESWMLEWHYRSRDESLIAFSNRHIYDNQLVTFPSVGKTPAVAHVLVQQSFENPDEESVAEEVRQVVALVLDHATRRPNQTLGVITMGITHAQRIEKALDDALLQFPHLDPFFDEKRDERFFVKNLERVQGDERDAIILSIGYGKTRAGNLQYRFGPLLQRGGERRLNVAITRARQQMTVVSSFGHEDMDPARSRSRGVELLRLYLHYASEGTSVAVPHDDAALGAFEADVLAQLRARGLPMVPRYGASEARIDFALGHTNDEQRFVVALETDGLPYRAIPTVRDRDRLRRQQLRSLGWRYHRLWALDWFAQRDREIARIIDVFMAATREKAAPTPMNTAPPIDAIPASTGATVRLEAVLPAATGATVRLDATPSAATGATVLLGNAPVAATGQTQRLASPALPSRSARPAVEAHGKITRYEHHELVDMARWIKSDGILRTDEEIIDELIEELGFSRRGPRILAALRRAVRDDGPLTDY